MSEEPYEMKQLGMTRDFNNPGSNEFVVQRGDHSEVYQ